MGETWTSWRAITGHWDIVTTGAWRGSGLTPVAYEIDDLVVQTGRLAYRNPRWTPAYSDTSQTRDLGDLACSARSISAALSTVHHAADAINRIAADDHRAVLDAANDSRLYVPTRLLPDTYDIPQPYTPAPRAYVKALLIAYDTAIEATASYHHKTGPPSHSHQYYPAASSPRSAMRPQQPGASRQTPDHSVMTISFPPHQAGRSKALRKLGIRDPALLRRSALIDQAAQDLINEAATKAHNRQNLTGRGSRPARGTLRSSPKPAQIAGQDVPGNAQASQLTAQHLATAAHEPHADHGRPLLQQHPDGPPSHLHC